MASKALTSLLLLAPVTCFAVPEGVKTIRATEAKSRPPQLMKFDEKLVPKLKVPAGFKIQVFAKDVEDARMIAVAKDGTIYVTQPDEDTVTLLRDTNQDGTADDRRVAIKDLDDVHGIALKDGKVWLAAPEKLFLADINPDGTFGKPQRVGKDLPEGAGHERRTIGFDDQGWLYVSVGSTCNDCVEEDREHATMLRMKPDGSERKIFARGLRNTIGFGWHPTTRALWGMDHGADMRGNDIPNEELNHIQDGKDYGWPFVIQDRVLDPKIGASKGDYALQTEPMVLGMQAHSAPIGFAFYDGAMFGETFKGDAFVAVHGSWNRDPPVGSKIVRVKFEKGRPVRFEDFVSGWMQPDGKMFGRVSGLAVAKDGALIAGDDAAGVVYRISR